jgi:transposase
MSGLSIAPYFPFTRMKIVSQNVYGNDADLAPEAEVASALIQLEPDRRYLPLCHDCRSRPTTVHSRGHVRMIRDLNLAGAEVMLQVAYRKVWCPRCGGVRVEKLDFADTGQRVTHRLARYVHDLCALLTVKDVAEHLNLDPKTVKEIDKAYLEQVFGQDQYDGLRVLMIDEIALHKGHRYMTVVADYFTGRVIWMGKNRDKNTLDGFFKNMTKDQRRSIEAVTMDMWEPFINRVHHYLPWAKIVFDFFHVVQGFGRVIDEVRRSEYARAKADHRQVIKGSRYLLLKNEENLTADQRQKLNALLEVNRTLATVYILKDQLKMVFYTSDRDVAKKTLDDWCAMAEQIRHPAVRAFVKRLRFFEYGILNHVDYPIDTSRLEGINNKIKVIKRKAYGFHDDRYFTLKVKQACAA